MNVATLDTKHVPAAPLRTALLSLNRLLSRKDMAQRWFEHNGRTRNSAQRYIERVIGELEYVPIGKADEICLCVLRCHPINIYGDEW